MFCHGFRMTLIGLLLAMVAWPVVGAAQSNSPLVAESAARRHGLVRAWWRQVPVDSTRDEVEALTLQGDTLYVQTRRGTISALNSEDGKVRWSRQIGSPTLVTSAVGANDKFAAVINGMTLYVLNREDGKIAFERKMRNVAGAGPALSGTHVFTPTTNGSIEAYDIFDSKQPPQLYNSTGRAMTQPFAAGITLAWTTDRGLFYVAQTEPLSPRFRVETYEAIIVGPGYQPPYLYVGSLGGHVMKVHEVTGNIVWKVAVGEPVDVRPMVLGDRMYVSSRRGGLRCILAEAQVDVPKPGEDNDGPREGTIMWQAPQAGRLLAGSDKHLYCLDELGRLSILRRADGGFVDSMSLSGHHLVVQNDMTDRVYFATASGTVQCLHEAGIDKPLNHRRTAAAHKPAIQGAKQKEADQEPAAKPEEKQDVGDDLFGGENAVPKKAAPKADDAFGGEDVFGGEEKKPAPKKEPMPDDADAFGN
jgi:outer membrane protein assembly factor BamB